MNLRVLSRSCRAIPSVISTHSRIAARLCAAIIENASSTNLSSFRDAPLRFNVMKRVALSRSRWRSSHARAFSSTQRSITAARPLFSAADMIALAGKTRPSASRILTSTSKFRDPNGERSDMIGCIIRNSPSGGPPPPKRPMRRSSCSLSFSAGASRSYTTSPSWCPLLALRQALSAIEIASLSPA